MMPYIRLYTSLIADLDFLGLDPDVRCMWYECLLYATEKGGFTPSLRGMARIWGMSTKEVEAKLYPLVKRGWLIVTDDYIEVTGWQDRQPKPKNEQNAKRQADYRQRLREARLDNERDSNALRNAALRSESVTVTVGGEGMGGEGTGELPPNGGLSDSTEPDPKPALKLVPKKSPKAPSDPNVRTVFGLWQILFFHGDAKLTDERRTKIAARLGEYGVDDCCRSLLGYRIDDWDERFGGGLRTHDLGVLFRNGSQLEKGLGLYKADEANALKYCPPHLAVKVALSWANLVKSGRIQEGLKVSPELWAVFSGEHREGYAPDMPEILVRVMRQQLDGDVSAPTPEESAIIARLRGSQNG